VAIGGGYTEFAGFLVVHQKPLGSLVYPQSQDRRIEDGGAAASDRSDRWVVTPKILIIVFNKILLSNKCLFKDF
jgi:hypothetical protein